MSCPRQYHKRQAKARQRQRRTATERLQRELLLSAARGTPSVLMIAFLLRLVRTNAYIVPIA